MSDWSWLPAVSGLAGSLFSSSQNQASARAAMDFQREVLQNRNQWAVEDLRKAGLNPILAAGTTQSTAQGATSMTENPATSAVQSYLGAKQASLASRQQLNQDAIARAQVSVLQSQSEANSAKAAKDYQDIAESKERVGIYAPQAQSYGSSAEVNRANVGYINKMSTNLDYQAKQIISNLETAKKERDLLVAQAQSASTQSARNVSEARLADANKRVSDLVAEGKKIVNQGTALDVRSKELGMSKQETLNYYHGNYIGKSFTILGEMLSSINPFKFK